ncbi:hypothetical protein KKA93_03205 [Patescibacteria group bacterium]|nr:hypothetical protein [Patescibacteria group bacterium]MBU1663617.1 hypothetical protein [Patescibacteria group bacterium]MBU1934318.1 hypothetical protein [Patescibacteria group bacterium]MBU2233992.1 hypothetical protein [Patescibacteria group bacterium]MBU2264409.1 hypothetical protein [Patescibacteria group bacterium]
MQLTTEKLKELLVGPGHISEADFILAAKEAEKSKIPLERLMVEKGLITDEHLGKTIAARLVTFQEIR